VKYTFTINQAAAVELGDIDAIDCMIIEWLRDLCASQHPRMEQARKGGYTWVSYSYAITDMPLLGLNSAEAFRKRLKSLLTNGYFKAITHGQKVYVKPTPKMDRLFYNIAPPTSNHQPQLTAPSTTVDGRATRKTGVNHQPQLINSNPITKTLAKLTKKKANQPPASDETIARVRQLLAAKGVVKSKADIVRHTHATEAKGQAPIATKKLQKPVKSPGNGQKRGIERQTMITQLADVLM
jgi:hypothetical protein